MVCVDPTRSGLNIDDVLAKFRAAGMIASGKPPKHVRLVTNRHHNCVLIQDSLRRIRVAIGQLPSLDAQDYKDSGFNVAVRT
jgi:threonine aldolase